jgi:hypothetical protein
MGGLHEFFQKKTFSLSAFRFSISADKEGTARPKRSI